MDQISTIENILAIVVLEEARDKIAGGAPVFIVPEKKEQERVALLLSRIFKAMAHDLENGVMLITRH